MKVGTYTITIGEICWIIITIFIILGYFNGWGGH